VHVAIIGNGIAGITTARELRKRRPDCRITVISGESDHHYSRPALMYVFMGHLKQAHTKPYEDWFWEKNRIDLVRAWVCRIDPGKRVLELEGGKEIAWDELVIATGSRWNRFGWPGQDLEGVQGLVTLQDLELLERNVRGARKAVIVGGGLIGIELAEMLHTRGIHVTFLVREPTYWGSILPAEESAIVNDVIRREGIELRLSTQLKEIVDDGKGRASAVVTDRGERIDCQIVGLTAGVSPNADLAREAGIPADRGVLVDLAFATDVPHVHAAGDCAEIRTPGGANRVEQLWYTGKLHGEVLGRVLAGERATYDRGVWFNSAKFLDLEYQTYGSVNLNVPGERNLYWQAPDARHAMRVVYTDEGVIGFDSLGIRYRHRTCERWIREKRSIAHVLENLPEANFDPEFFRRHERDMVQAWKAQLA
jgi:NADPH-dependent 2,4-dienoyl-CoA reductase/sulfur reductase-like enzyme